MYSPAFLHSSFTEAFSIYNACNGDFVEFKKRCCQNENNENNETEKKYNDDTPIVD